MSQGHLDVVRLDREAVDYRFDEGRATVPLSFVRELGPDHQLSDADRGDRYIVLVAEEVPEIRVSFGVHEDGGVEDQSQFSGGG